MEIYFSCTKCGQNMKIDSQYSGMTANCPKCQTELLIPITNETPPPQESENPPTIPQKTKPCPKCGTPLRSESAVLYIECGYNMNSGMVTATKKKKLRHSLLHHLQMRLAPWLDNFSLKDRCNDL